MGSRRRRVAVVLVVAVLATGCRPGGGGDDPSASPTPTTPSASPSPSATPSSTPAASPSATPSPSTSPTPSASPTAGGSLVLAAQFTAFIGGLGGPGDCSEGVDEPVALRLFEATQLSIGESASLCFVGFDVADLVRLDVAWPDGSRTVDVAFDGDAPEVDLREDPDPLQGWVDVDGAGRLVVRIFPGSPRGDWQLTASQGEAVAVLEVQAAPAPVPQMERTFDTADDVVAFWVSGFPQGAVPVGLYRLSEPTVPPGEDVPSPYVTAILERQVATVVADADGAAVVEVEVGDLGPGTWCVDSAVTLDDETCEATLDRS